MGNSPVFQRPGKEGELNRTVFNGSTKIGGNVLPFKFGAYDGGKWMQPINDALQAVITGKKSVDQAISDAQNDINNLVK